MLAIYHSTEEFGTFLSHLIYSGSNALELEEFLSSIDQALSSTDTAFAFLSAVPETLIKEDDVLYPTRNQSR